jgi:hypothetical protein
VAEWLGRALQKLLQQFESARDLESGQDGINPFCPFFCFFNIFIMAKVTYLFGAGASADCLPVINQMQVQIGHFASFIERNRTGSIEFFKGLESDINLTQAEEMLIKACRTLEAKCADHASIDTYAKKLFITNANDDYSSLKITLSCFLVFIQSVRPPDKRYDSFFASVLKAHHLDFLSEIEVLSWNYDYQFEKAYSQFSGKNSLSDNQTPLQIYHSDFNMQNLEGKFAIFKINGSTGFTNPGEIQTNYLLDKFELLPEQELVKRLAWFYLVAMKGVIVSRLSFAWEKRQVPGLKVACERIKQSKALVIIGYSFPFFNRDVDRQILKAICEESIPKIYVQDKTPAPVISRLMAACPEGVVPDVVAIDSVDQFYLPAEL